MSSACLALHPTALIPVGTDRAFSQEGSRLTQWVLDALENLRNTETVGAPLRGRRLALDEAVRECSQYDWDGYGAAPADELSVEWAARVLDSLPADTLSPEITFDPQGEALLEWMSERGRLLSVSVGAAGELRFALRTPASKLTGIETFTDEIPAGLAHALDSFTR
jgi:hypothetical protein